MDEAELDVSQLADVVDQGLSFLDVGALFVGIVEVLELFEEQLEVFFFERHVAHGDKGCVGGLGCLDKVFPAIGVGFIFPHDAGNIFANVAGESAHAVAFNEGDHVVFK